MERDEAVHDAGDVREHVDRARLSHDRLDVTLARDVRDLHGEPVGGDLVGERLQADLVDVAREHMCALTDEACRGREADARGRTGDDRVRAVVPRGVHGQVRGRRRTPCMPPSTARAMPVVALADGDARYRIASATSAADTSRPDG